MYIIQPKNEGAKMVLKEYRLAVIAGLIGLPTEQKKGKKHHPNLLICSNQKYQLKKDIQMPGIYHLHVFLEDSSL